MTNNEENICWFHRNLSRDQADQILQTNDIKDGYFLVRQSNSSDGDFVLSVRHLSDVYHYQIRRHGEDAFFSIDDKEPIHGLDSLIAHYQAAADGLIARLTTVVRGEVPPPDSRSHGRTNLLHRATKEGDLTVVSELLKCGYRNVDAKNQDGLTAVHLACRCANEQLVAMLIASGANVNCRDKGGNTPLHYACATTNVALIKLLVAAKANLQARNNSTGCVPLHDAARKGHLSAVCELLALGAPLRPRSTFGELPIDFARDGDHQDVIAYLDSYTEPEPPTFKYQWYHGTLDRHESNRVLKQYAAAQLSKDELFVASGLFLVRFSSKSSDFVLTLLADDQTTKHFIIQKYLKFLYIDEGPYLPSLEHLVQHYTLFSDGLPVNLRVSVPPTPKPPLPLFSTMPKDVRHKSLGSFDSETSPLSPPPPIPVQPPLVLPPKSRQQLSPNHKPKPDTPIKFLTLTTKKKNIVIDGMRSLQKARKSKNDTTLSLPTSPPPLSLADVSMSLQNLSFSAELYNVPTNNAAVESSAAGTTMRGDYLFTESDRLASDELVKEEDVYFVDAPAPVTADAPMPSNYVPTKIVARFTAEPENATNLNQPPPPPPRLDRLSSTVSLTSTASDRFFRQLSVDSTANLGAPYQSTPIEGDVPNYFIPAKSLQLAGILGEGEFGSVFRGTLKWAPSDGAPLESVEVAIKTLHDEHCKTDRAAFLREASVMIKLSHHCIVRLVGISRGPPLMMVQELVGLGSMLAYILEQPPQRISVQYEIKLWAAQIACGMDYLESQHFVHRDLAARNILLASRHQAKISDFGLSRALAADNNYYQASQGGKWPIKWYAPESFNYGTFSHASDVWSFGVTLWEMFSFGLVPFGDMKGVDVIKLIEAGERLTMPAQCPEHVFKCMESCWNYKPRDRPTFQYLTQFFASDPDYQNVLEMISSEQIG